MSTVLANNPNSQVRRVASDIAELVKARLSLLVLSTTLIGFLFGWRGEMNVPYLLQTLFATALAAAGAAALNQVFEVEFDARMRRTRNRPLPTHRMSVEEGMIIGVGCSIAGILWLALGTNLLAGVLAAVTIGSYVFVYTPLKRVTTLNTIVGALPGALPPVIGWVAARGRIDFEAWLLFAILFLWQMPHFLALAWLFREDYKQAGFVMLGGTDQSAAMIGRQGLLYTMALISVSLMPAMAGLTTVWYFVIAAATGIYFGWMSLQFAFHGSEKTARRLFVASIVYLPITLGALVLTRA
jgi:protoheme IX farnesyltransferase